MQWSVGVHMGRCIHDGPWPKAVPRISLPIKCAGRELACVQALKNGARRGAIKGQLEVCARTSKAATTASANG